PLPADHHPASLTPTACPKSRLDGRLQPDGQPKPVIDHDGILDQLLDSQRQDGAFDYRRAKS
ncbi:hypothetical protein CJ226_00005, partial [Microbacterium sp. UMB0228]|uniref:hypothetical protein n=1 Tax=Microbacterium sp. UMB0228 TaxID=2029109 RepID=UPI000CBC0D56